MYVCRKVVLVVNKIDLILQNITFVQVQGVVYFLAGTCTEPHPSQFRKTLNKLYFIQLKLYIMKKENEHSGKYFFSLTENQN